MYIDCQAVNKECSHSIFRHETIKGEKITFPTCFYKTSLSIEGLNPEPTWIYGHSLQYISDLSSIFIPYVNFKDSLN